MAEPLVSEALKQLGSIMAREIEQEVRLVVGVKDAVDQLTSNLTAIKAVLADAETRQAKEAIVRDWLEKLKDVAYDIKDVLDDWEAAILSSQSKLERKVCSFLRSSCKQVCLRHDIARKIKELNGRLDRIAQEKDRYQFVRGDGNPPIERSMTTSKIDLAEVKGREEDKNELVKRLLSEPSDGDRPDLRVISLVGMGGIGKTTLAQFAFNDAEVNDYFDKKIWVCVSDPFNEIRVVKAILESISKSTPNVTELESLLQELRESVEEKKILLIMDDMWEEDSRKWNQLKQSLSSASPKSKILVTTRKENVALRMGCSRDNILKVGELSVGECWLIISKIAFFDKSEIERKSLENVGKKLSEKCDGLPLAAKALGGILQFRRTREEWESILSSGIWELEQPQKEVIAPLWLSYYDLPSTLKRCFSYCAIFSKDYEISKNELIELWMAQGYLKLGQSDNLEITGENYFRNLEMRSLFQDFDPTTGTCKMHDMVHDLAQLVARDECVGVQVNSGQAESIIGSPSSKVRHLSLDCSNTTPSFKSFDGTKKLRSLFIRGSLSNRLWLTTEELSRLFSESTHVRSLSLRYGGFEEIPSSIHKLVQLRWLDLSWNNQLKQLPETLCELHSLQTIYVNECSKLQQLPETLCELHSLQTIYVTWCSKLQQLPHGIGKLINLRHLHNKGGPSRLPKGIAELTGLRTLEEVDVGYYGRDGDDAFSLGDLKNLNQLRGKLEIRGLGARHMGEAKQAELKKKEHITRLDLLFSSRDKGEHHQLLEALEPSPNLESLWIWDYRGTTFPGWMISLMNLRSIHLMICGCEHVPSLGKLPSLDTLVLMRMGNVKKVGVEVLGIEQSQIGESKNEISTSASSSSIPSPPVVAVFPKLTTLEFWSMPIWEEWDDYYDGTSKPPPAIQIMPSLRSLKISNCPRLKALPDYILQNTMLQSLGIYDSHLLKTRYKVTGADWFKVYHISRVKIK